MKDQSKKFKTDREVACSKIDEAINQFDFKGCLLTKTPYGNGHINDTFLLEYQLGEEKEKYIFQRINHQIFEKPEELMENIEGVTSFLKMRILEQGGDYKRETLCVVHTKDKKPYYKDSIGSYWRAFLFIENAISYELAENPDVFYESGLTLGKFQGLLSDYETKRLHETIKDFHNTAIRLGNLKKAIARDCAGRVKDAQKEIRFALEREETAHILVDLFKQGDLPLRVTHNDTKLNNVMIDIETKKGLCMIDLDTVMPGLSVNDFGDSIRFGASTALEGEIDFDKVSCDLALFEAYTKGYLKGCQGKLEAKEVEMLPMGAKMMTYECGIRFLTDYLQGDQYFKTNRANHNLDRCRTQFKLVEDMEQKWDAMKEIVHKYANLYHKG